MEVSVKEQPVDNQPKEQVQEDSDLADMVNSGDLVKTSTKAQEV